MQVFFAPEVQPVVDGLPDHAYQALWDILERILEDPNGGFDASWAKYVSTKLVYGSKVPGSNYTVYWRIVEDRLEVPYLLEDAGL